MLSSLQREILFLHNYIELKYSLRSLESSSSSLTTVTPVNPSSHNSSWDEVRTQYIKLYMYLFNIYDVLYIYQPSQSQSSTVTMQGGRGKSFFPVRGNSRCGETSSNLNSFYNIPPPNFSFRPGVSMEKLL